MHHRHTSSSKVGVIHTHLVASSCSSFVAAARVGSRSIGVTSLTIFLCVVSVACRSIASGGTPTANGEPEL